MPAVSLYPDWATLPSRADVTVPPELSPLYLSENLEG